MAEFADIRAQVSIERVFTEMLGVSDFQKSGMRQLLGTCRAVQFCDVNT